MVGMSSDDSVWRMMTIMMKVLWCDCQLCPPAALHAHWLSQSQKIRDARHKIAADQKQRKVNRWDGGQVMSLWYWSLLSVQNEHITSGYRTHLAGKEVPHWWRRRRGAGDGQMVTESRVMTSSYCRRGSCPLGLVQDFYFERSNFLYPCLEDDDDEEDWFLVWN